MLRTMRKLWKMRKIRRKMNCNLAKNLQLLWLLLIASRVFTFTANYQKQSPSWTVFAQAKTTQSSTSRCIMLWEVVQRIIWRSSSLVKLRVTMFSTTDCWKKIYLESSTFGISSATVVFLACWGMKVVHLSWFVPSDGILVRRMCFSRFTARRTNLRTIPRTNRRGSGCRGVLGRRWDIGT
jgi:hypothetical protein